MSLRPSILDPLFAPVTVLPGVGPKVAPLLNRLLGEADRPARVPPPFSTRDTVVCDTPARRATSMLVVVPGPDCCLLLGWAATLGRLLLPIRPILMAFCGACQ